MSRSSVNTEAFPVVQSLHTWKCAVGNKEGVNGQVRGSSGNVCKEEPSVLAATHTHTLTLTFAYVWSQSNPRWLEMPFIRRDYSHFLMGQPRKTFYCLSDEYWVCSRTSQKLIMKHNEYSEIFYKSVFPPRVIGFIFIYRLFSFKSIFVICY